VASTDDAVVTLSAAVRANVPVRATVLPYVTESDAVRLSDLMATGASAAVSESASDRTNVPVLATVFP
jgi:hypothetical protein